MLELKANFEPFKMMFFSCEHSMQETLCDVRAKYIRNVCVIVAFSTSADAQYQKTEQKITPILSFLSSFPA